MDNKNQLTNDYNNLSYPACEVQVVNTFVNGRNLVIRYLKDNAPNRFFFYKSKGLYKYVPGKKYSLKSDKANVLMQFINLAELPDEKNEEGFKEFFEENGYLFPFFENDRDTDEDEKGDIFYIHGFEDIKRIAKKLKHTVELAFELEKETPDYKNLILILNNILRDEPVEIKEKSFTYRSCVHSDFLLHPNNYRKVYGSWGKPDDTEEIVKEYATESAFTYTNKETEWKKYMYSSCDFISRRPLKSVMQNEKENKELYKEFNEYYDKLDNFLIKEECSHKEYYILSFLRAYWEEIQQELSKDEDVNMSDKEPRSDEYIEYLKIISRLVLADEINYHIKGVDLYYDIPTLIQPRFIMRVNSLLEAMYMSLAMIDTKTQTVRCCKKCGKYFIVNKSNSRKVYCSATCQNNRMKKSRK